MSLTNENIQALRLMYAMIGAVSPNFRRTSIEIIDEKRIILWFLLEQESEADREEIAHIAFEFEALQESGVELATRVLVDQRSIEEISLPGRTVFGRREPE